MEKVHDRNFDKINGHGMVTNLRYNMVVSDKNQSLNCDTQLGVPCFDIYIWFKGAVCNYAKRF